MNTKLKIELATYCLNSEGEVTTIKTIVDGKEWFVPMDSNNSMYAEIMRQVEAGTLVIQEATDVPV